MTSMLQTVDRAWIRQRPLDVEVARAGAWLAAAVVIGMGAAFLAWALSGWQMGDARAYWDAALRLRAGEDLYPAVGNELASNVFRYSPWFAWAAIPFTYLPQAVAGAMWSAILVMASAAAVWPLYREGRWVHLAFFWPILLAVSASGNVQALMLAGLVHGVERRSGPLWIALAASLKAVPLVFVLVYVGRRQWRRAGATLLLSALLVAPVALYDLHHYPTSAAGATLLASWLPVYALVAVAGVIASVAAARTRFAWLASAATAVLVMPRFFTYDVTLLLVGTTRAKHQGP